MGLGQEIQGGNKMTEDKFATIRETFEKYLDIQGIQCFPLGIDGQCWASTPKRLARITVVLPRAVVDNDLKDLNNFVFFGIAMPRKVLEKKKKEDEKK
jgi:hypothetical protein